jgi:predicted Fe-Mo cluster-binding NifX family protein
MLEPELVHQEDHMRIAITSNSNLGIDAKIFDHFGHTPYFTIVDIHNDLVKKTIIVGNPFVEHHQPGEVPSFLAEKDVNIIIAGGMGEKAKQMFNAKGIEVITGTSGSVGDVIDLYLKGKLQNDPTYEPADKDTFHQ